MFKYNIYILSFILLLKINVIISTDTPTQVPIHITGNLLVDSYVYISDTDGGFTAALTATVRFGESVTVIGDVNNDGIEDIAVASSVDDGLGSDLGSVYVIQMNTDGTVSTYEKFYDSGGGWTYNLITWATFGSGLTYLNDFDDDGTPDIAVGAGAEWINSAYRGAVYLLLLSSDLSAHTYHKISSNDGSLTATIESNARFGEDLSLLYDLDGDNVDELVVGSRGYNSVSYTLSGAALILFLKSDGKVKTYTHISEDSTILTNVFATNEKVGKAVTSFGGLNNDFDNDNIGDIAISGINSDAIYFIYLKTDGTIKSYHKMDDCSDRDISFIGQQVTNLGQWNDGDLDADGVKDLLVSGYYDGSVYFFMLQQFGHMKTYFKISSNLNGFTASVDTSFGVSAAVFSHDMTNDGFIDIIVGAPQTTDSFARSGAIYLINIKSSAPTTSPSAYPTRSALSLSLSRTIIVQSKTRITENLNGFTATLGGVDTFGVDVAVIGDIDNDNVLDILVGQTDINSFEGAVYILFLTSTGIVKSYSKITEGVSGFTQPQTNERFGISTSKLGRWDDDTVEDILVSNWANSNTGVPEWSGAIFLIILNINGTVKTASRIDSNVCQFSLFTTDAFGLGTSLLSDLDNDNNNELAVGISKEDSATANDGGVYILFMNNFMIKTYTLISQTTDIKLSGVLQTNCLFGRGVSDFNSDPDFDGDGISDLIVGSPYQDDLNNDSGAIFLLLLNTNASIKTYTQISNTSGSFTATLATSEIFGMPSYIGDKLNNDIDGDNVQDILVSSRGKDSSAGAVYILLLKSTGNVKTWSLISSIAGSMSGLTAGDQFGYSVASFGNDINGDGFLDILVGSPTYSTKGAIYILSIGNVPTLSPTQTPTTSSPTLFPTTSPTTSTPTTSSPTTSSPTTSSPTTSSPTTSSPTTSSPTTSTPTTSSPTTSSPTTSSPTTSSPTTSSPTTSSPTTSSPTTSSPTISSPTTSSPTTSSPTTSSPTTSSPTTSSPTTSSPTTSSPTTSTPTTSPTEFPTMAPQLTPYPTSTPTTSSPTTSSPTTSSPTTSPTEFPTMAPQLTPYPTSTPTTSSPTTSSPTTSSPTTSLPTTSSPTTSSPTTSSPTTSSPTTSLPTTSSPTTQSPTQSPTTPSPTTSTPYPTQSPTQYPTTSPTNSPTLSPILFPTKSPTLFPTKSPTTSPTLYPTLSPTTHAPTPTILPQSLITLAKFSNSLTSISLQFNSTILLNYMTSNQLLTTYSLCSSIFDDNTLSLLGTSPKCTWTDTTKFILKITFGNDPLLLPIEYIANELNWLSSYPECTYATSSWNKGIINISPSFITSINLPTPQLYINCTFINEADNPISVESIISSSSSISNCDDIELDVTSSSGSGGRDLIYEWNVINVWNENDLSYNNTELIRINNIINNLEQTSSLIINNNNLIINDGIIYEFELYVENFLNDSYIFRKNITFESEDVYVSLGLSIQGGNNKYITNDDELTIQTSKTISWSSECNNDNSFIIPSYTLSYTWLCISSSPLINECPDITSDSSLYGKSNGKNIYIPSNYLGLPGMEYKFKVELELSYTNNDDTIETIITSEIINIYIESNDLIAKFKGGSSRSILDTDELILDGSTSYDPDDITDYNMMYNWTCEMWFVNDSSLLSTSCLDINNNNLFTSSQCYIPLNNDKSIISFNNSCLLSNYWYSFTLTISKPYTNNNIDINSNNIIRTSSTSTNIFIIETKESEEIILPSVYVEPREALTKYDISNKIVIYRGLDNEESFESLTKRWTQINGDLSLNEDDDDSLIWTEYFSTKQNKWNLIIRDNILTQGVTYEFKLTVTDDNTGSSSFSTITIPTNIAPTSGYLTYKIDNINYYQNIISSISNKITVQALSWVDDGDYPLKYSFGYIDDNIISLESNNKKINLLNTISQQSTSLSNVLLPQGKKNNDYILTLIVEISDSLNSITQSITNSTNHIQYIKVVPDSLLDNNNDDDDTISSNLTTCEQHSSYISTNLTTLLESSVNEDNKFQLIYAVSSILKEYNITDACTVVEDICSYMSDLIIATSVDTDISDESIDIQITITEHVLDTCTNFISRSKTIELVSFINSQLANSTISLNTDATITALDIINEEDDSESTDCYSIELSNTLKDLTNLVGASLLQSQEEEEDETIISGDSVTLSVSIQSFSEIERVLLGDDEETSPYFLFPESLRNSSTSSSYSVVGVIYENNIYNYDDSSNNLIMDGVVSLGIIDENGDQVSDFKDNPLTLVIPLPEIDISILTLSELRDTLDNLECQYWQEVADSQCTNTDTQSTGEWIAKGITTKSFPNSSTTNYNNLIKISCDIYHLTDFSAGGSEEEVEPETNLVNPISGSDAIGSNETLDSLASSILIVLSILFFFIFFFASIKDWNSRIYLEELRNILYVNKGCIPKPGTWKAKEFLKQIKRFDLLVKFGLQTFDDIVQEKKENAIKNKDESVKNILEERKESQGDLKKIPYEEQIEAQKEDFWESFWNNLHDQHSWVSLFSVGIENRLMMSRPQRTIVLYVFLLWQLMANALFLGTNTVTVTDRIRQAWFAAMVLLPLQSFLNNLFYIINIPRNSSTNNLYSKSKTKNIIKKIKEKKVNKVKPIIDNDLPNELRISVIKKTPNHDMNFNNMHDINSPSITRSNSNRSRSRSRSHSNSNSPRSRSHSNSNSPRSRAGSISWNQNEIRESSISTVSMIWRQNYNSKLRYFNIILIILTLIGFILSLTGSQEIYFDGQYFPVIMLIEFILFGSTIIYSLMNLKKLLKRNKNGSIKRITENLLKINSINKTLKILLVLSLIELIIFFMIYFVSSIKNIIDNGYEEDWIAAAKEAYGGTTSLESYLKSIESDLNCCGWNDYTHYSVSDSCQSNNINNYNGCDDKILYLFYNFDLRILIIKFLYLVTLIFLCRMIENLESKIHLDLTKLSLQRNVNSKSNSASDLLLDYVNANISFASLTLLIIKIQKIWRGKKKRNEYIRKLEWKVWIKNSYLMFIARIFVYCICLILLTFGIYMNLLYGLYFIVRN